MIILQIEHPVPSFEEWKRAFDSDPVDRQRSGVRRYRILRPVDDPNFVVIDLNLTGWSRRRGCGRPYSRYGDVSKEP